MGKRRNITVCVTPELYRQTRRIAVDADTTITELVRHILIYLPELLARTRHPSTDVKAPVKPPAPASPSATPAPQSVASVPPPAPVAPQTTTSSIHANSPAPRHVVSQAKHDVFSESRRTRSSGKRNTTSRAAR